MAVKVTMVRNPAGKITGIRFWSGTTNVLVPIASAALTVAPSGTSPNTTVPGQTNLAVHIEDVAPEYNNTAS